MEDLTEGQIALFKTIIEAVLNAPVGVSRITFALSPFYHAGVAYFGRTTNTVIPDDRLWKEFVLENGSRLDSKGSGMIIVQTYIKVNPYNYTSYELNVSEQFVQGLRLTADGTETPIPQEEISTYVSV